MKLAACLAALLSCVALLSGVARADSTLSSLGGTNGAALESPLVAPGVQPLIAGQGIREAEAVELTSPEAVAVRERSQTSYENLSGQASEALVGEVFPDLVGTPAGGPPQLAAGERATGFPADNAMSVEFGEGRRGVIESSQPMAVESASGTRVPLDLGLVEAGGSYTPKAGLGGLTIPKRLREGVRLANGISLTPVEAGGADVAGSEGVVDGAVVSYTGTGTDEDVVVKPGVGGFSEDTILLSERSVTTLDYRVGLPSGDRLVEAEGGSGAVEVMSGGAQVALILPPHARDATGANVPVAMSVSGDTLNVALVESPGQYTFPIAVDPEVVDGTLDIEPGNWFFGKKGEKFGVHPVCSEAGVCKFYVSGGNEFVAGEYAFTEYQTQGLSHIFEYVGEEELYDPHVVRAGIRIESPGKGKESSTEVVLPKTTKFEVFSSTVCVSSCAAEAVTTENKHNAVIIEDYAEESGWTEYFRYQLHGAMHIEQEASPKVAYDSTDLTIGGKSNADYATGGKAWVNSGRAVVGVTPSDPGIGIKQVAVKAPGTPSWGHGLQNVSGCYGVQCDECWNWVSVCASGESSSGEPWTYSTSGLPEGKDTIEVTAANSTGASATLAETVQIDNVAPHNITLVGMPSGNKIGEGSYQISGEATDGSGAESSGVASIALNVDGRAIGHPSGSCPLGTCTAKSSPWTISGAEFGAGQHTLTLTATDKAGNSASESFTFTVQHSAPIAAGPGSVNPVTGELNLGANDVSISGGTVPLTVSRAFNSRHLTAGVTGPLGPQWSMSLGGQDELVKAPTGSVTTYGIDGGQTTFAPNGKGGFTPPAGDTNLSLSETEKEGVKEYLLKDATAGTTSRFKLPSGGGEIWTPSIQEGPIATDTTSFAYQTVEVAGMKITEPTEVLAPVPSGVSCAPKLERGCRALTFTYASSTTASGENQIQWGEYEGRLAQISFTAWDPTKKEMTTTTVAQYTYDKQGRLRAEWDPQITPALKNMYGYDAEGHVTAVTPPGQQPWLISYGTANGDPTPRFIASTRPAALTAAGDGELPSKSTAPALSTTSLTEGDTVSVSNGTWSNSPLSYSYQWFECSGSGEHRTCTPIVGATNQTYTPQSTDRLREVYAVVTATNATGSVAAASNTSSYVQSAEYWTKTSSFGAAGEGNGQFKDPWGIAVGESGDVYVADSGNSRIEKFSSEGTFIKAFGKKGSGANEFNTPEGLSIKEPEEGKLYIADSANNRVAVASQKLEKAETLAIGKDPVWTSTGETSGFYPEKLYVTLHTKDEIERFAMERGNPFRGAEYGVFGKEGTGNGQFKGVAGIVGSESNGDVYVVDEGGDRVEQFTASDTYLGQFGTKGSGNGQLLSPKGIATYDNGFNTDLYVVDSANSRVEEFNQAGEYVAQFPTGSEPQGIAFGEKHMYVTLGAGDKVEVFEPTSDPNPTPEPPKPGSNAVTTIEYNVPVSGTGAPFNLSETEVGKWAQKDFPKEATAVFPPDEPMGWPAKDYKRATLYYRDNAGRTVNVAQPNGGISTTEYNATNDIIRTLSPDNRATALAEGSKSKESSETLDTQSTYNSEGNQLQSTLGPQHTVKLANGMETKARQHTTYSYNEGAPSEGGPYNLPTKIVEAAKLTSGEETDARTTTIAYSGQSNLGWKLRQATSVTTDPSGLKLTHTTLYDASSGNVIETRMPASPGAGSPHDTQTIYYTAGANSEYPSCGEHREWAGLACQTQPAAQPKGSLPPLAISTDTYNVLDEPESQVSTSGSARRTTQLGYDASGRPVSKEVTSTTGTGLPKVTYEYNGSSGALEKQSMTVEGKTQTVTSVTNPLGELTTYIDADGNEATYTYDIDGRLEKTTDGKGNQNYSYDPTTGFLTKLVDSAAENFTLTASYDAEGNIKTEGYPNGMTATYTRNQTGKLTGLEYVKTTHCTSGCTWFSDKVAPSIHGQWLSQASSLSSQAYTYDAAGRLTQVQNTPAGKGCTTRIYKYDEDTNRLSLTTREPGTEGKCASEGGTTESHTYDEADRLTDTGTSYDAFGDILALPARDAGGEPPGGSELTSTYYVDGQVASQTQNGQTQGFKLDPTGRTRENVETGKTNTTIVSHYDGPGNSTSWVVNTAGEWTRYITGISGTLVAVQSNAETPVLQLTNLHDDIIATAYLSETATGLASSADTSEYGVPTTSLPPKYSWLGAIQVPTELPSGVAEMGARSYVPELGRFLQPDPRPGGSANAYSYTFGDPVNTSDPSGEYTAQAEAWMYEGSGAIAQAGVAARAAEIAAEEARIRAAIEAGLRIEAERAAELAQVEAERAARAYAGPEQYSQDEEGGGDEYFGGSGLFANNEDPGLPPGARCEGNVDEKRYKKEHPKLCHEIEHGNVWEPLEFLCFISPALPLCDAYEKIHDAKRIGH